MVESVSESINTTTAAVNESAAFTDIERTQNQTREVDDDVDDDNEGYAPAGRQLVNESSSPSPKSKREHRVQTSSSSSSSSSSVAEAAADFQHTNFGVTVTHHVTAFITWPQSPDVACSSGRKVVGYQLRYRHVGASDYVSRYLSDNLLVLDELAANTRYRYQLQYVTEPPSESLWSQEAELDTTA